MTAHVLPLRTYFAVWAMLLLLLAATIGLDFIALGSFNIVATLGIAVCKAALVILFFMHVRHSSPLIWLAAVGGFYWLSIMMLLSLSDYITRG